MMAYSPTSIAHIYFALSTSPDQPKVILSLDLPQDQPIGPQGSALYMSGSFMMLWTLF